MQFNNVASRNGIIQLIEKTTKLGLGTISGNAAPDYYLDYFTVLVNNWNGYFTTTIQRISGEATYDDVNNTGFATERYSSVNDQQDYGIDTDISATRMMEIRDATEADTDKGFSTIPFIEFKDRVSNRFGQTSGTPTGWWMEGRSFIFDVPIDTAKIDIYRATYDRHASTFATSDTTKTPGFDSQFHPGLYYGPSLEWATIQGKAEVIALCKEMLYGVSPEMPGVIKLMKKQYKNQIKELNPKVGRKQTSGGSWA